MSSLFGVVSGCFADKRIPKKKAFDTSSPEYKQMLHRIIHNRTDSGALRWIEADKELKKYKENKK